MRWFALACLGFAQAASAQDYPVKPIRFIVGFVDNRAGGSGTIAAVTTAKAPPDGYTLLMSSISTMATNVSTVARLQYDPLRDFAPITLVLVTPYLATVQAVLPANTLQEFIALAKARPGQLNFGSSGTGGGAHLAVEMFKVMAGIELTHVPYKGSAPALTDLLGGHIQLTFSQPPLVLTHIRSGKLKGLAVTSARRLAALPEFPTIAESGLAGYDATSWQGAVAPAGTPRAIVMKLNSEINRALKLPEIGARLAAEGSEPGATTPDEFAAYIKREIVKWAKVIKESGIKAE
ncbi:MAG: tripartite tricarboxylate transporter substrate binding protein [Betaproteobacteria bacterium]|nr:tripartite tricarboxylate transporter substrate binding protein [Betaproteobacteria bacterium]